MVDLLFEYKDVFGQDLPGIQDIKYHIDIKPDAVLPKVKTNYFTPHLRPIVEQEIEKWKEQGIIVPGSYKYAAPLLLVKKKCTCELSLKGQKTPTRAKKEKPADCPHPPTFRLVSDNRQLNKVLDVSPFMTGATLESITETMFSQKPPPKYFTLLD